MPKPSPDRKWSMRNLRSKFKNAQSRIEDTMDAHASQIEKLKPRQSNSDPFNGYVDLTNTPPTLPYSWNSIPSTPSSGFPSPGFALPSPGDFIPRDKTLPGVPPIPQITVTEIINSVPSNSTPSISPPALPHVDIDCDSEESSALPWVSRNKDNQTEEAAPPRAEKVTDETKESQIVPYSVQHAAVSSTAREESMQRTELHVEVLDVSAIVYNMKSGINDLPLEIPRLVGILDDVARIHPSISIVVLAFKAAYNMERTRRENDKRILLLYAAMKDMLSVLIQLRDVQDRTHIGPDGQPMQGRLESVSRAAAKNIKDCANACDTYLKKTMVVRVLRSQVWEERLTAFFGIFAERRRDFELALAIHTANGVDAVGASVEEMSQRISELTALVRNIYSKEWVPSPEQQLARKIEEKGGAKFIIHNDAALSELCSSDVAPGAATGGIVAKLQGRTVKGSAFTLQNLKDELFEDWESAVRRNMETFEGKFALYQRQLQEELTRSLEDNTNRILDEMNRGPHDKIKNKELRDIWKEMDWKLNVKARQFVMTLRDHYKERAESAAASSFSARGGISQRSDDWAFEFINAKYLQPIMEAFDDDGSGYVTYQEVNEFVDERPASLAWSLPHWVAYWAIGWQITANRYREKIIAMFAHMFSMRTSIKAENRYWVDHYLRSVWPAAFELTQSLRSANAPEHIEDKFHAFAEYEEERIRKNLEDIRFDIDALDTVYVVAGPGRIEKYIFPLMYLLLRRDITRFSVAKTKILHKEELLDAADSLLWVLKAVNYRYLDLCVLAKQNHLNVDQQMRIVACGLFDYLHSPASLWTWRNLQDAIQAEETITTTHRLDFEDGDLEKALNYPLQDEHNFKCSVYDLSTDQPPSKTIRSSDAVQAVLGEWNGFIYTFTQYPARLMISIRFVAEPAEQRAFRATGMYDGVSFNVLGRARMSQSQRGRVNVAFTVRYARQYSTQFFSGFIDAEGALVGTEGWEDDPATHTARFVLRRVPARVMCYRPSPVELYRDPSPNQVRTRVRALWRFALDSVVHEVRRWLWSWNYFQERRDVRLRYIELSTRFNVYGHKPNEEELVEWSQYRRQVLAVDASFYRILRDEKLKIIPAHECYCQSCHGKIGGARVVCQDCLPIEAEAKTMDFCDNPACWGKSHGDPTKSARCHLPTHDIFKVRTVLHLRDVPSTAELVGKALNVSREYFQTNSQETDIVGEALAPYYDINSDHDKAKSTQCNICRSTIQQPCWFCADCFAAEKQVYICDHCESKTLLQCIRCARTYKQSTWYYGTHSSDNFMCNTCNWKREIPPDISQGRQHTYLHTLVRCTPARECMEDRGPLTTDDRIVMLEESVAALDGRMERLEDTLLRIEQLLISNLSQVKDAVSAYTRIDSQNTSESPVSPDAPS